MLSSDQSITKVMSIFLLKNYEISLSWLNKLRYSLQITYFDVYLNTAKGSNCSSSYSHLHLLFKEGNILYENRGSQLKTDGRVAV